MSDLQIGKIELPAQVVIIGKGHCVQRDTPGYTTISGDLEKYFDKYFDERPQLKRPKKTPLGYSVPIELKPIIESLINKRCV